MKKIILLFVCLLPMGCIQLHYNIAPEFHSEGAVNIDGRIDADDPRVTVTVDDVTVDWKELKELIEKKMASLPKEPKQKMGLAPAHAVPAGALTLPAADAAGMDAPVTPTHSVQVGAYRRLENAEQQVARLAAKGYPARLVPMADSGNQTWYTVRIGDYPTQESARTRAVEFTRREKVQTAVRPFGTL
jgi:cell division protein FtsN